MKKLFAILIIISFSFSAISQDDDFQTIFGDDFKISGFGGPNMSFTSINGNFADLMGGGGAVLLNDMLFFGGGGMGVTTNIDVNQNDQQLMDDLGVNNLQGYNMTFGYGGLWTGYIHRGKNAIHPVVHCQFGWGGIEIEDQNGINKGNDDRVFVINPVIELEANITRFFRFAIGGNYRVVQDVDLGSYENKDFSGPGAFITFKFGWF